MSMDPRLLQQIRTIARDITGINRRLTAVERAPKLAHSSYVGSQVVYDEDGNVRQIAGLQEDGTYTTRDTNAEPSPVPSVPYVQSAVGGIFIQWDGFTSEPEITFWPIDFSHIEVHVSVDPDFEPTDATEIASFHSPKGGTITYQTTFPNITYVGFVSVNTSGVESAMSMLGEGTPTSVLTDGLPPGFSPYPTLYNGVGSIFARWSAITNSSEVMYEVHLSTSSSFVPDHTTLITEVSATSTNIRTQASGSPLEYDTDYFAKIVAKDADDPAAPSEVSNAGRIMRITGPDVAAEYVYANEVRVSQLIGGTMSADVTISGSFKTATEGQRTEIDSNGLRQIRPDGGVSLDVPNLGNPRFTGIVNAESIVVSDGLELRGKTNTFNMGSRVILETATSGSATSPGVVPTWPLSPVKYGIWPFSVTGFHIGSNESGVAHLSYAFINAAGLAKNAVMWRFPEVKSNYSGQMMVEFTPYGLERVRTFDSTPVNRTVVFGQKLMVNDEYPDAVLRSYDTDSMTESVAPVLKRELKIRDFNFFHNYALGRCFSSSGNGSQNMVALAMHNSSTDEIRLDRYTIADGSPITNVSSQFVAIAPWNEANESLRGCMWGNSTRMGFEGASTNIWVIFTNKKAYVYQSTTLDDLQSLTRLPLLEFTLSATSSNDVMAAIGNVEDGTGTFDALRSVSSAGEVSQYSNFTWNSAAAGGNDPWWASFTWYHEPQAAEPVLQSNLAVPTRFQHVKRSFLQLTTPRLPDPENGVGEPRTINDVNSFRPYFARSVTRPVITSSTAAYWSQSVIPPIDTTTVTLPSILLAGSTHPPVSSTFVAQSAAAIESDAVSSSTMLPKVRITGDGFAHFENLDVSGGGVASIQKLIVDSSTDANTGPNNEPPLRVGNINAVHLRIDNNEIVPMSSNSTPGVLNLGGGEEVTLNGVFNLGSFRQSTRSCNVTAANSQQGPFSVTFSPAFSSAMPIPIVMLTPNATNSNATVAVRGITRAGFDIYVKRETAAAIDIGWAAFAFA